MNNKELLNIVENRLKKIYKSDYKNSHLSHLEDLVEKWEEKEWDTCEKLSEKNIYLITYGDSIEEKGKPTLATIHKFLNENAKEEITDVHLLPMFEYTSDDGFSVIDYRKIDPKLGDWNNINDFAKDYRMMYDFVANHMSKSSPWFKGYLAGDEKYKNYFISRDEEFDSSIVVRPRTSPLFHDYKTPNGELKSAWSTFSEDQVDLNARDITCLTDLTDVILDYAYNGATSIRLDAIGFLWKESGTGCMHLPETHEIIKMWRDILDYFKEGTQIITETNVPHLENISYFGDTKDEAHQVYQFTLPPLTLFSFTTHNTEKLTKWAKGINNVSETATFFNFLSSHDGIGMRPTEGILTEEEKNILADKTLKNGGKINYKSNPDGTQTPYELNIVYQEALLNKDEDTTDEIQVQKILASHALLLSMVGVPAIYYHSLLGSRNDYKGLEESGINRRINREKLEYDKISKEIVEDSRRNSIFEGTKNLIRIRQNEKAFSPYAPQNVLDLDNRVFALERINEDEKVTFIVNTANEELTLDTEIRGTDIISNKKYDKKITLPPYAFVWIK